MAGVICLTGLEKICRYLVTQVSRFTHNTVPDP